MILAFFKLLCSKTRLRNYVASSYRAWSISAENSVFTDISTCPLKTNKCFRGICRFNFRNSWASQRSYHNDLGNKQNILRNSINFHRSTWLFNLRSYMILHTLSCENLSCYAVPRCYGGSAQREINRGYRSLLFPITWKYRLHFPL